MYDLQQVTWQLRLNIIRDDCEGSITILRITLTINWKIHVKAAGIMLIRQGIQSFTSFPLSSEGIDIR